MGDTDTDSQRRRFAHVGRTRSESGGMGIAEDKCRFSLSKYQEVAFLFSSFPLCILQKSIIVKNRDSIARIIVKTRDSLARITQYSVGSIFCFQKKKSPLKNPKKKKKKKK